MLMLPKYVIGVNTFLVFAITPGTARAVAPGDVYHADNKPGSHPLQKNVWFGALRGYEI
jgi:hypothetical protein